MNLLSLICFALCVGEVLSATTHTPIRSTSSNADSKTTNVAMEFTTSRTRATSAATKATISVTSDESTRDPRTSSDSVTSTRVISVTDNKVTTSTVATQTLGATESTRDDTKSTQEVTSDTRNTEFKTTLRTISPDTESTRIISPTATYQSTRNNINDDDSIYNSDSEDVDDKYDDYYYLQADISMIVTRLWNIYAREKIWYILKDSLDDILKNSNVYDEDNIAFYVTSWDVTRSEDTSDDDDDDNRRRRVMHTVNSDSNNNNVNINLQRRLLATTTGSPSLRTTKVESTRHGIASHSTTNVVTRALATETVTEKATEITTTETARTVSVTELETVTPTKVTTTIPTGEVTKLATFVQTATVSVTYTFDFSITVYSDSESIVEGLYDYIVELADEFEDDYVENVKTRGKEESSQGFGDVTVLSAVIGYYDSDGNVLESTTYGTISDSDSNGPGGGGDDDDGASNVFGGFWISVYVGIFSAIFVFAF